MNLVELRQQGCNTFDIRRFIHKQWAYDGTRYVRGKRAVASYFERYGTCAPGHEIVRKYIKQYGKNTFDCAMALASLGVNSLARRVSPEIFAAIEARGSKGWTLPVWGYEGFIKSSFSDLHYCHVSSEDPTKVAYTPNEDKLLRDVQVRMKPGRYLMQFYGPGSDNPVLSEAECKEWADRQVAAAQPVELKLVPNTDPDGWVWVYENSGPSCMRYNRTSRYLESGLYGYNHPVRCYAHPENDLSLAYIMLPGIVEDRGTDCGKDEWVVAARTIVNTENKTWLRIYAESDTDRAKLEALLTANGYGLSRDTLRGQNLQRLEYNGSLICPYLDGDATQVDDWGDYLVVNDNGGFNGRQSGGLIETEWCTCPRCGGRVESEDDLTYVECREESICSDCLDDYTMAYVNRYDNEYIENDDAIEIDGEYYSEAGAEAHGFIQCENGDWHRAEDTAELNNGDLVYIDDAAEDEVSGAIYLRDEMVDSVDGLIHESGAVETYDSGMAHVSRCYALRIDDRTVYVHRNFLEDLANSSHFARLGDQLIFAASGRGVPIVTAFKPTNVVDGEYTNNRGANCLDDWELPDEDEFVGPLIPININSNVLYMEAA